MPKLTSLGVKLTAIVVLSFSVLSAGLVAYLTENAKQTLLKQFDSDGKTFSRMLAISVLEPMLLDDFPVIDAYANELLRHENMAYIKITRSDGKEVLDKKSPALRIEHQPQVKFYTSPIVAAVGLDKFQEQGKVTIGISTVALEESIRTSRIRLAAIVLAFFGAFIVFYILAIKRTVISKLVKMQKIAKRVAHGDLTAKLPVTGKDELALFAALFNLMTDRLADREKKLESALIKARASDQAKGDFLANISHEIKTPLNAITGASELLHFSEVNAEQKSYIELVLSSSNQLVSRVDEILTLTELDADNLPLKIKPFNLRQQIIQEFEAAYLMAGKPEIEVMFTYSADCPAILKGDSGIFGKIFHNLIDNAFKFTDRGHIAVGVNLLSSTSDTVKLHITVEDTGCGIPKDKLETIFDVFTQVDNSSTRNYGGAGVGLSICKKLVDGLGGIIYVGSEINKGSQFFINLSLEYEPIANNHYSDNYFKYQPKNARVLIAYPVEKVALSLSKQLFSLNINAEYVTSYDGFLDKLNVAKSNSLYDYIFIDEGLFNFGQARFNDASLTGSAVFQLGAYLYPEQETTYIEQGLTGYIEKPFFCETLLQAITLVYQNKGSTAPALFVTKSLLYAESKRETNAQSLFEFTTPPKILLVDDNEVNLKITGKHLSKIGCDVTYASNGLIGVEESLKYNFDLIFMDCQMPVLDGFEATKRIRQHGEKARKIPIIALSANTTAKDREACRQAGMNDFLSKPVKQKDLKKMLALWLDNTKLPAPEV